MIKNDLEMWPWSFHIFILLFSVCMCVCVFEHVCVYVPWNTCRNQKTIFMEAGFLFPIYMLLEFYMINHIFNVSCSVYSLKYWLLSPSLLWAQPICLFTAHSFLLISLLLIYFHIQHSKLQFKIVFPHAPWEYFT